jgi:hypothetical protein
VPGLAEQPVPTDGARALDVRGQRKADVSPELTQQVSEEDDADLHVAAGRPRNSIGDEHGLRVPPRGGRHLHHAARAGA